MDTWFLGDVLKWREFGGTAWSVAFNTGAVSVLLAALLTIQTPAEPISVIIQTISTIFSPSSWLYLICGTFCVVQLCKVYAANAKATPTVAKSVLTCAKSALTIHLLSFIQFTLIAGALSFILVRLTGSELFHLYVSGKAGTQLNPIQVCVILSGCFAGVQEAVHYHFENGNYIQIPIINLDKYSQVKYNLQDQMFTTCLMTLRSFRTFYIGFCVTAWVVGYFTTHDVYYTVLTPSLIAATLVTIFYVKVVCACVEICMRAHFTAPLPNLSLDNMLDGAASKSSNLLTLLSLQNLCESTYEGADVRRELFSLSIPGGHPHQWNKLQSVTLKNLQGMNADLGKLFKPPVENKEESNNPQTSTPLHPNFARRVVSPNMRMLAPAAAKSEKSAEEKLTKAPAPPKWVESLNAQWKSFVSSLSKRPVIGWMINEPQDFAYRQIFTRSQAAIYSAEILSYVVRASIEEDGYGVVQKDLPEILSNLLKLEESVDRCRVQANSFHHRKRSADPEDVQLKQELKCALKSAVYRVTLAFKEHILVVPLEADLANKIRNCHNFVEA